MASRDRLITFLQQARPDFNKWGEDTPLVGSAMVDSLVLLQLAVWVEGEIGQSLDPAGFDLATDWSTVGNLLSFIDRRAAGKTR